MWAVAAQPRTGLTPMIPTPSVDSGIARAVSERAVVPTLEVALSMGAPSSSRPARLQCRLEVRGLVFGGSGVGRFLHGDEAALRPQQGRGEDDAGGDETGADAEGQVVPAV